MSVRAGMNNLIARLRALAAVGTSDYSIGNVSYWSSRQLQDRLDGARTDMPRVPLTAEPEYSGGSVLYHDYCAPLGDLEEASSGSVYWSVQDSNGNEADTDDYTVDYIAGRIRFASDQGGTAYYLRARSYHLKRAAAGIWREKAGQAAAYYSFSADGQSFSRSDWFDHCMKMANEMDGSAGMQFSRISRVDLT